MTDIPVLPTQVLINHARSENLSSYAIYDAQLAYMQALERGLTARGAEICACQAYDVSLANEAYEAKRYAERFCEDPRLPEMQAAPGFRFLTCAEVMAKLGPTNWLVNGILVEEEISVVFGKWTSGKSLFAQDLMLSIASGVDFHGREVKQGVVFYICGEGGGKGLAKRFAAWGIARGVVMPIENVFVSETPALLDNVDSFGAMNLAISELCKAGVPVLIVVDTLAKCMGGDENASKDMSNFLQAIERLRNQYKCHVMVVHHTGHLEGQRARGSSALPAGVDCEYKVAVSGDSQFSVQNTKMKDALAPDTLGFEIVTKEVALPDGGKEQGPALLSIDYVPPKKGRPGSKRDEAMDVLVAMFERYRANLRASGRDPDEALVSRKDWADECKAAGISSSTFYKVVGGCVREGIIAVNDAGFVAIV